MRRLWQMGLVGFLLAGMLVMAVPTTAVRAMGPTGYYWSLECDFEQDWNCDLEIEVGPWVDGQLESVKERSTATVYCRPVGNVVRDAGDAVFDGAGYLVCEMDLAATIRRNHGLVLPGPETYGSMVMRTRIQPMAAGGATLLRHPDAFYGVKYHPSQGADLGTELWNGAGLVTQDFPMATIGNWQVLTYQYVCGGPVGPCETLLSMGNQQQVVFGPGVPVQFSTGATRFTIGGDGATFFKGRMSHLRWDPGNFGP